MAVEGPRSTTVERATAIMELLARHGGGMSITELSRAFDAQRASLYRILNALIAARLVTRDAKKNYLLGVGTVFLSQAYLARFPAGIDAVIAQLANSTGLTVTLVSEDNDVLTTVLTITPSGEAAHLYTPPGYVFPSGPLATRTALKASLPPSPDDDEEVIEARAQGYAAAVWRSDIIRYGMSAVVPYEPGAASRLAIALISITEFETADKVEPLLTAVQTLGGMIGSRGTMTNRR
ncbi:MAG TPA: helix-turn-helix domain-containing protein [Microbacteriaceae bacterium]|nr:helix-turn-helix domain-containing protein [Microbacteriaceae bacterium]